jgi:hypothetical protein
LFLNVAGNGEAKDRKREGEKVEKEGSGAQRRVGSEDGGGGRHPVEAGGGVGSERLPKGSRGGRPPLLAEKGRGPSPGGLPLESGEATWKVEEEGRG